MSTKELRELSDAGVSEKLEQFRKEAFNLKLRKSAYDLDNTSQIGKVRKEIARLETILTERKKKKGA